jgi:hypothetical protein
MSESKQRIFTALCGILGTIALMIYFSAPFWIMPLPKPDASMEKVVEFGNKYHNIILWDTWLQQFGSILSVIFVLSLVQLAGTSKRLAGRLTLLACTVILSLSLAEGTFVLGAIESGRNGHPESALTCFELTYVFIHIFLLAPSLFLLMGFALYGTNLLPRMLIYLAIVLGILFQILGVAGLFNTTALIFVIFVLMAQNIWTLAASIALLVRKPQA